MKTILQSLSSGVLSLAEAPLMRGGAAHWTIRTRCSLISAGTERMLLEFGKAGWLSKVRQQPDKVRQVLEKVGTDGVLPTWEAVRAKLDQPIALGYANAGVVLEGNTIAAGTRVVSNGAHAEAVRVPVNLCAVIPDVVSDEEAAFTVVASIALQGVRLVQPTLGEAMAVTGLGLIGLIAVQLLRASGCRVLGIDFDPTKLELARRWGAETVDLSAGEDPVAAAERFTRGRGLDGVLITAATKSSEPVHQAAVMCRKRGRIVLTGVTGLELSRDDFYKKELSFQVSCSYGPGRYDASYEERGVDYPVGYVRWTAQRNFEAVLDMMADGRLDVRPLISHRFPFEQALEAYAVLEGKEPYLGIVLQYPVDTELGGTVLAMGAGSPVSANVSGREAVIGMVGAGGYATKVLLPAFRAAGAAMGSIASRGGMTAAAAGRKFGFAEATTDVQGLLTSERINCVVIATRHDTHAALACQALAAGKHVFVEKPLAMSVEELEGIGQVYEGLAVRPILMVGFNRRFAPLVLQMRELLRGVVGPKTMVVTINAGAVPSEHWTMQEGEGGGRILGEGCHFIDLIQYLIGGEMMPEVQGAAMNAETATITLRYEDGSLGTLHYFANGSKSFPKERVEVFAAGRVLQLDNFRRLQGWGWKGFRKAGLWSQDKGNGACVAAFVAAVKSGGPSPIGWRELDRVTRISLLAAERAR
jgi:predicted dehydrogenase/threonine dehydrogenase-like Zn-dependent dehydrogenase